MGGSSVDLSGLLTIWLGPARPLQLTTFGRKALPVTCNLLTHTHTHTSTQYIVSEAANNSQTCRRCIKRLANDWQTSSLVGNSAPYPSHICYTRKWRYQIPQDTAELLLVSSPFLLIFAFYIKTNCFKKILLVKFANNYKYTLIACFNLVCCSKHPMT